MVNKYCKQCGSCCQYIFLALPKLAKQDGSCKHLIDNKCEIYENRPSICNTKKMYDESELSITYDEYLKLGQKMCEEFRKQSKL